jgi:cell division protein FtsW
VPKRRSFDRWLLLTAALMAFAGLFMVGSASHYIAMSLGKDPTYFLIRHGAFLGIGLATMAGAMALPLQRLDRPRVVGALIAASLALLLLVLAMPAAGGAHRWFRLGPLGFQPSELAKISTVLLLAYLLSRRSPEQVNDLRSTLGPAAALVGAMVFLIVIEPDLGSAVMVLAAAAVMLFVAGLRFRYLGAALGRTYLRIRGKSLDDLVKGVRRPDKMKAACERMDRMREENRKLFGEQDIAVRLIRETRDGA